ncbi:MAG: hypothetical protein ACFFB5_14540 [Promethearchaeota archaeon]
MGLEHPTEVEPPTPPSFMNDFMNTLLSTIITVVLWILFFAYYEWLRLFFPLFFGISIGTIVATLLVFFLTYSTVIRWLDVWAYQIASWRSNVPYMNYQTKCPFLQRKLLSFTCRAEQIAPFEVELFEKCHKELMWEACWPERIPSILLVYDEAPAKMKQQLAFILAAMKEHALPAAEKMHEVLTSETLGLEERVSAGYALEEMKDERGIEPLITMVAKYDQRTDKMIRAILTRYQEMAIPYLIDAVQNCENDIQCGGYIEVMGKIGHDSTIPVLENLLMNDTTGDYSKLHTIYAFQEIGNEEAFKILIAYLEKASDEEQSAIKQVCLARKLISLPMLIDLLSNTEISEDYYARIGDILAEVDANTYDRFFTKIGESQGIESVQRLAAILKENTPEEEEFIRVHEVLSKYLASTEPSTNITD